MTKLIYLMLMSYFLIGCSHTGSREKRSPSSQSEGNVSYGNGLKSVDGRVTPVVQHMLEITASIENCKFKKTECFINMSSILPDGGKIIKILDPDVEKIDYAAYPSDSYIRVACYEFPNSDDNKNYILSLLPTGKLKIRFIYQGPDLAN